MAGATTTVSIVLPLESFGGLTAYVVQGTPATTPGAGTILVAPAFQGLKDGIVIQPFSTTNPITIGSGAGAETVTPTAVTLQDAPSQLAGGPGGSVAITGVFTKAHGHGDLVQSSTGGRQEAAEYVITPQAADEPGYSLIYTPGPA